MIILSLALTTVLLLISAAVFPFLDLSVQGFENNASILDAVLAFNDGRLLLLALATAALILLIPALRAVLLFYVMFPVVLDRPPYPGAKRAFRWADLLKPWSMAEIFAIGCAVALVKITALANVAFGAAFWMFAVLVLVVLIKDRTLCKWTVWESLDR